MQQPVRCLIVRVCFVAVYQVVCSALVFLHVVVRYVTQQWAWRSLLLHTINSNLVRVESESVNIRPRATKFLLSLPFSLRVLYEVPRRACSEVYSFNLIRSLVASGSSCTHAVISYRPTHKKIMLFLFSTFLGGAGSVENLAVGYRSRGSALRSDLFQSVAYGALACCITVTHRPAIGEYMMFSLWAAGTVLG